MVNVSLRDEVYEFLKSLKKEEESFSDVIMRFQKNTKGTGKELAENFGGKAKNSVDWNKKQQEIKKFRKSWDSKVKNLREK